jgi:glycosyltransferase involved in cell wall biosynthesis
LFKRKLNPEWYLKNNPDVAASGMSAEEHYRLHGKDEGRLPCPPSIIHKVFTRGKIFLRCLRQLALEKKGYFNAIRTLVTQFNTQGYYGLKCFIKTYQQSSPPTHAISYAQWIVNNENEHISLLQKRALVLQNHSSAPLISIVMATYNTPAHFLHAAIKSVLAQSFQKWELCIADDHSTTAETIEILTKYTKQDKRIKVIFRTTNGHISEATNTALSLASGNYVAFMDHDDLLHPAAFVEIAQAIIDNPNAGLIYSDEDKIDDKNSRSSPSFKPDFNYELLLAQNYICHLLVVKNDLIKKIGGLNSDYNGAQDHDFIFRAIEHLDQCQIIHIPKVLYHWRTHRNSTAASTEAKPYAIDAGRRAVADHLARTGIPAKVIGHPDRDFWHRIIFQLDSEPSIDIIIPTRDRIDLMRMCINSILKKTSYKNYRIVIVDNGSVETETLEQFKTWRNNYANIQIIRDDSPFNYSRLNNNAVHQSKADLICLLNNDIEIISPAWLQEMAGYAIRPDIGCVGSRLWYPNNTLQHGGVIVGLGGVAGHSHKHLPKNDAGYMGRAVVPQALSAVTAACLMIKRTIYMQVNGLDEDLRVAFNDVDFCLRVRDAGYRNVWTPFAEMYHHESASRGHEDNPEKIARFNSEIDFMKKRWGDKLLNDPYYSPNLTLDYENFALAVHSRISTPI